MATQSDLNVSNWALRLIGHRAILTALSDTTTEGLACNAMVDNAKQALLRMHPWNFATKRKKLTPYQDIAVSNVTYVSANLLEITHTSTTFATGNYVTIHGVAGATQANGTWEIQSAVNGTTTRVTTVGIDDSGDLGTYEASDSDYIRRTPAFDYQYLYDLPSDNIRVLEVNGDTPPEAYKIEGTQLLIDDATVEIRYIYNVSDYTTMDALFYQCLAHYLAYQLCDHMSASDGKKNELHAYLYGGQGKRGILPQSRFVESSEDALELVESNDWILARRSSNW